MHEDIQIGTLKSTAVSTVEVPRSVWWRVYSQQHGAKGFNGSGIGNARFSPWRDENDNLVATLYCGNTPQVVLMESVLHDLPVPSDGFILTLPPVDQETRRMACLVNSSPLVLADFSTLGLRRLGLSRSQVIDSSKAHYPQTRELARWVYEARPDVQGIQWTSRQDDRGLTIVLFEPRLASHSLHVWQEGEPISVPHVQTELYALLDVLGAGLVYD